MAWEKLLFERRENIGTLFPRPRETKEARIPVATSLYMSNANLDLALTTVGDTGALARSRASSIQTFVIAAEADNMSVFVRSGNTGWFAVRNGKCLQLKVSVQSPATSETSGNNFSGALTEALFGSGHSYVSQGSVAANAYCFGAPVRLIGDSISQREY